MKKTENTIVIANNDSYFTVSEAAEMLRIKTQTVRDYLTKGTFKTYKFKTLTLIDRHEIESRKHR
jgi:excisionase family DNA binding protein